jgi:hypothetical protein
MLRTNNKAVTGRILHLLTCIVVIEKERWMASSGYTITLRVLHYQITQLGLEEQIETT